jgi:hypothetical protein
MAEVMAQAHGGASYLPELPRNGASRFDYRQN